MSISLYSASVPVFETMLGNLSHFLDKAQANAEARKFDPAVLLQYLLAPDMLPFTRQVLIACDAAKLGIARLAGVDAPKFDDTESSIAELKDRIAKTVAFLASVPAEKINGLEGKDVTFPAGRDSTRTMKGEAYIKHWVTPNMYFHLTMAYAILRHNGVDLGKTDYLLGSRAAQA